MSLKCRKDIAPLCAFEKAVSSKGFFFRSAQGRIWGLGGGVGPLLPKIVSPDNEKEATVDRKVVFFSGR